jgi:DNA-binding protein H-NS
MKQYGLTVADLGGAPGAKKGKSKSNAPAKFKGPNGELWAGGPGRKPEWVRAVLASGKSIEDFRI